MRACHPYPDVFHVRRSKTCSCDVACSHADTVCCLGGRSGGGAAPERRCWETQRFQRASVRGSASDFGWTVVAPCDPGLVARSHIGIRSLGAGDGTGPPGDCVPGVRRRASRRLHKGWAGEGGRRGEKLELNASFSSGFNGNFCLLLSKPRGASGGSASAGVLRGVHPPRPLSLDVGGLRPGWTRRAVSVVGWGVWGTALG